MVCVFAILELNGCSGDRAGKIVERVVSAYCEGEGSDEHHQPRPGVEPDILHVLRPVAVNRD